MDTYSPIYLLHQSLAHSASRSPEKCAVKSGGQSLSYEELLHRSNQLAHLLRDLGVKKGDRVGILLNRCIESVIAVYGIMSTGAAFVPLDPTAPENRTLFLLRDCGIQYLVSQAAQERKIRKVLEQSHPLRHLIGLKLEEGIAAVSWEEIQQLPSSLPDRKMVEQDLAYIMYTSGSTGQPKGIMHTHHSGLNYAKMSASLYGVRQADIVGNHAPLHFDISTFGYFSAPLVGATSIIIPKAYTLLPASLSQLMEQEAMSIWYSVPLALIQLLIHGVLKKRDLSSLRWVLFGGEPFPTKHLRALMQQWPHARFSNVYGPAEVNQCTYFHLPVKPKEGESVPLGELCPNVEMRIVDEKDEEVSEGQQGELLIRTPSRMQGYWKQPGLTQKGLYTEEPYPGFQKVFYRTGDLVQLDEKGRLLFLGRKDRQIKLRSYRVELDEIEAVLVNHGAVQEAAMVAVSEQEILVLRGAVILKSGETIQEQALQAHLARFVPAYAVPDKICILDAFPYTSSGKVNYPILAKLLSTT